MKKLIIVLISMLAFSCEDEEPNCLTGTVIGYEMCTDISIIALENTASIGAPYTYSDSVYQRVIKVPGIYTRGTIYFSARKYIRHLDEHLLGEPKICPAISMPVNVPVYTITAFSYQHCP